jgi:flagellar basal body-associated protein FliL
MQNLRRNPVLAIILLVAAVAALAVSFYFSFARQAAPQSPFSQQSPTNPPTTKPEENNSEGKSVVF